VVEPYLGFLPHDEPLSFVTWTYLAAGAELAGAAGLTLGLWTRLSALSLFSTMGLAVYFHVAQSGLEGFPLGVVEKHQYAYEPAALYCLIYFYFLCTGGGRCPWTTRSRRRTEGPGQREREVCSYASP
jgi:uncharacterized membrane protein YphA (DoxX/SURF4 family)